MLSGSLSAQKKETIPLAGNTSLVPVNVTMSVENYLGKKSLKVIDIGKNTEVKFVKTGNLIFKNGTIEINVAGKPAAGAVKQAMGFVGVAFRIKNDNSGFECICLRPTNGRAEDQVRRNHSVQYVSFPGYPWYKMRKDFREKYESYVDLVPGEWTKIKIVVKGKQARLYVHGNTRPTLIVNDLKMGEDAQGSIGLWIGPGTEAHFSDLDITREE